MNSNRHPQGTIHSDRPTTREWHVRKRVARLALLVGTATALVLGPSIAAIAGQNDGYCDNNEVCVYSNANLGVPRSDFLYYYDDMSGGIEFHTYNYPSSCNNWFVLYCRLNDSISSVDSWSDHRSIRIFTDAHYDGAYQKIGIYGRVNQVTYNDQTSSECWNDGGVSYATDPDCTFPN